MVEAAEGETTKKASYYTEGSKDLATETLLTVNRLETVRSA